MRSHRRIRRFVLRKIFPERDRKNFVILLMCGYSAKKGCGGMTEKIRDSIKNNKIVLLLLLTGAVYFFLKFLSPLVGPVLLAMVFVTIFGPFLKKLQDRFHIHRQIGAVLLLVAAVAVLVILVCVLTSWIVGSIPDWTIWLEEMTGQLQEALHDLCDRIGNLVGVNGAYLETKILNLIQENGRMLGKSTASGMLSQSLEYMKIAGAVGGFLVVFFIAAVLLAKDYDDIMNKLLDNEEYHVLLEVICGVIRYIATFIKAQAVIMTVIGTLCAATLGISGFPKGILWGILAGVLDALPFIGTGVVLTPLAVIQIMQGNYGRAVVCAVLYVVCIFVRELLEPRLIGKRMGIPPIAVLLSLYAGIQLFGVGGIIKGPLGFVMIAETYRSVRRTSGA